jgi:hypothetical protein
MIAISDASDRQWGIKSNPMYMDALGMNRTLVYWDEIGLYKISFWKFSGKLDINARIPESCICLATVPLDF